MSNIKENPIAEPNSSFLGKIKTFSSKKKKNEEDEETKTGFVASVLVGMNNAFPLCAEACACCWDKEIPTDFEGIAEYVAKRSRIGHTSVLEHSNFVMMSTISKVYHDDLVKFLDWTEYLNHRIVESSDGESYHMLLGGSYRGYCDLYRQCDDLNNPILKSVTNILYTFAHSAAFEDICKLGLMDKSKFMNIEPDENFHILAQDITLAETDRFKIVSADNISHLYTNIHDLNPDMAEKLTTNDLINFVTITILFKNMSRTCTHQLVRHRNAITQESQRYVDYSEACFSSPAVFKPEKYDPDYKYKIHFGSSGTMHMTLEEIGDAICGIYEQLRNPLNSDQSHVLLKEDARAYLPGNVQCKKIYMTFTYKKFMKFLDLREDKAAQAEIRLYANGVGDWFRSATVFNTKELCDLYTKPRLLIEEPIKIDVIESVSEEVIEMTEADYIRATGLDKEDGKSDEE